MNSNQHNDASMKNILRSLKTSHQKCRQAADVTTKIRPVVTPSSPANKQRSSESLTSNSSRSSSSSSTRSSPSSASSSTSLCQNHHPLSSKSKRQADKKSIENMIRTHPLLVGLNKNKPANFKPNDDDDDQTEVKKNINENSNNNTNGKKRNCFANRRDFNWNQVKTNPSTDEPDCSTEAIRKKLHRANKVFYNGFLQKQENNCLASNSAKHHEYQAHAAELLNFLKSLWLRQTMCDLHIVVENRKYFAHRLGLAMFSRKYKSEFEKQLNSKDTGVYTICLKNSSKFAVECILKYIYTAKIDINPANVEEILTAARELGIDDLICMANDYLNSLSIGDVLDYMRNILTNKEGSEQVLYDLYAYVMTHLDKISRTPEYLKSSVCVVKTLLTDSHLHVVSELEVFEAAMRWIEFDRKNRLKCLYDALKCVRFTLVSPDELVSKVENHLCVYENFDLMKLIFNAYKYHALNNINSKLTNLVKKEDRRSVCLKGASVPEDFVNALLELANIAHKFKKSRANTTNTLFD